MPDGYVCPHDPRINEDVLLGLVVYKAMSDEERKEYGRRENPPFRPDMEMFLLAHLLVERCVCCREETGLFLLMRSVSDEIKGDIDAQQRLRKFRTETELFEKSRN
jgi:hypothetical protein